MSTAFSGIGAPEHAHNALCKALGTRIGREVHQSHAYAIEWNAGCRAELARCPAPPLCIFSDMHGFLHDTILKHVLHCVQDLSLQELMDLIVHPKALKDTCYCYQHRQLCSLRAVDLHVAGPPCTDWSSFGDRLGSKGKTALALAVWLGHRLRYREEVIIHENVEQCDTAIIRQYLGGAYHVQDGVILDPAGLGHPVRRRRRISILTRRDVIYKEPWNIVADMFARGTSLSWKALLLADEQELLAEIAWAANRKTSCAKLGINPRSLGLQLPENRFVCALTKTEVKHLIRYMEISSSNDIICVLGQNPDARPMYTSGNTLMTVLKSTIMVFATSPGICRWLTARELLAAQGFMTYACLQTHGAETCFDKCLKRSRVQMTEQAGNSMHNHVIGCALIYAFAWIFERDSGQESDQIDASGNMRRQTAVSFLRRLHGVKRHHCG